MKKGIHWIEFITFAHYLFQEFVALMEVSVLNPLNILFLTDFTGLHQISSIGRKLVWSVMFMQMHLSLLSFPGKVCLFMS